MKLYKTIKRRGSYHNLDGTSIDNTGLICIRGIHSWTNAKMKKSIHSKCKKLNDNILSVKRITKFNNSFFRIKVYKKFKKVFKKALSGVKNFIL